MHASFCSILSSFCRLKEWNSKSFMHRPIPQQYVEYHFKNNSKILPFVWFDRLFVCLFCIYFVLVVQMSHRIWHVCLFLKHIKKRFETFIYIKHNNRKICINIYANCAPMWYLYCWNRVFFRLMQSYNTAIDWTMMGDFVVLVPDYINYYLASIFIIRKFSKSQTKHFKICFNFL